MKIYMFAEHDDLQDFSEQLNSSLEKWAAEKTIFNSICRKEQLNTSRLIEIGLEFETNKSQKLKEPLNFLYGLAKQYECDFSVGIIEGQDYSDVCFFGFEEGKPDMFEIACYLGFE